MKWLLVLLLLLPGAAVAQDSVTVTNPTGPSSVIRLNDGGDECHHYPGVVSRPNLSGSTAINYTINADGSVGAVTITSTSGDVQIDRSAVDCAKRWKFLPPQQTGQSAPFTGTAVVTFADHYYHWQTPRVRDAATIALTDINGQGLKCLRAQQELAPVAAGAMMPTSLQIQFFRGEISRVKVISPPGNDVLERAAIACYSAIPKNDQRAGYLDKTNQVTFNLPWNSLYAKASAAR